MKKGIMGFVNKISQKTNDILGSAQKISGSTNPISKQIEEATDRIVKKIEASSSKAEAAIRKKEADIKKNIQNGINKAEAVKNKKNISLNIDKNKVTSSAKNIAKEAVSETLSYASIVGAGAKKAVDASVGAAKVFDDAFFEINENRDNLLGGVQLTKAGKLAALGFVLGAGVLDGLNTYDRNKMGTPQGVINTTPIVEPRVNPNKRYGGQGFSAAEYGAGGDLVFALNNLRRG